MEALARIYRARRPLCVDMDDGAQAIRDRVRGLQRLEPEQEAWLLQALRLADSRHAERSQPLPSAHSPSTRGN